MYDKYLVQYLHPVSSFSPPIEQARKKKRGLWSYAWWGECSADILVDFGNLMPWFGSVFSILPLSQLVYILDSLRKSSGVILQGAAAWLKINSRPSFLSVCSSIWNKFMCTIFDLIIDADTLPKMWNWGWNSITPIYSLIEIAEFSYYGFKWVYKVTDLWLRHCIWYRIVIGKNR